MTDELEPGASKGRLYPFSFADSPGRAVDAILLAHDVIGRHMPFQEGAAVKLVDITAAAKKMVTEYFPQITEVEIEIGRYVTGVRGRGKWLNAVIVRKQTAPNAHKFEIRYQAEDLNLCWSRYAVAKELSQLIGDSEPAHFSKNPQSFAKEITSMLKGGEIGPYTDLSPEEFAVYIAAELLLPYRAMSDIQAMIANRQQTYDIAAKYRVPSALVELKLAMYAQGYYNCIPKD